MTKKYIISNWFFIYTIFLETTLLINLFNANFISAISIMCYQFYTAANQIICMVLMRKPTMRVDSDRRSPTDSDGLIYLSERLLSPSHSPPSRPMNGMTRQVVKHERVPDELQQIQGI